MPPTLVNGLAAASCTKDLTNFAMWTQDDGADTAFAVVDTSRVQPTGEVAFFLAESETAANNSTVMSRMALAFQVPNNLAGGDLTISVSQAVSQAAQVTATVIVRFFLLNSVGVETGSNLVTTTAQANNTATRTLHDFVIDTTNLTGGERGMLVLEATANDTGGSGTVKSEIYSVMATANTNGGFWG